MIQFAPADAARSDTPPPVPTLEEIQMRRKLAEELMRQGSDASPVQHWTQGLARVASALSGRWQMDQAARQSGDINRDANNTLLDLYKPSVTGAGTGAGMPAVPQAATQPQTAQAPLSDDQQGVANFASGMNTQGLAKALPGKVATALDPSLTQTGSVDRSQFKDALQNPQIRDRLIALTHAEVGNQGPEAKQAFLESVINRAAARGQPLEAVINDQSYFPRITRQRAARGVPSDLASGYSPLVDAVADGSNTSKYATGNASGNVGFNGGPQTAAYGGERFGIEGPDKAWAQRQSLGPPPARTIWQAQGGQPQQSAQAPQPPTQVADASQGQGMTRATLSHMLANPLTRDAAQKYILEQANPKKADSQFGIVREGLDGKTYGWHNDKDQTIREYGGPKPAAGQEPQQTGIQAITQAIKEGKQSPELTNLYRKGGAVREELARQGIDHSKLLLEYASAKKQVQALNSPQMIRFTSLATSVDQTVDELRSLSKEMNNSGLMALNAAKLEELKQLEGNSPRGQLAARYITAANTLKEEFANLAAGGYAPTESAWKLADQQIHANYGVNQLNASLDEIQRLIRYRVNAIPNLKTLGPGADNRYTGYGQPHDGTGGQMPEAPHPAATHVWNPATGFVEAVGGR